MRPSSSRLRAAVMLIALTGTATLCVVAFGASAGQAQTLPPLPLLSTTTAPTTSTTSPPTTNEPTTEAPPPTEAPSPTEVSLPNPPAPVTIDTVFTPTVPDSLVIPVPLPSNRTPTTSSPRTPRPSGPRTVLRVQPITASTVSGVFGLGVAGALVAALLLAALGALARAGRRSTIHPSTATRAQAPGGTPVERTTARTRLYLGFACIAAAAVVALIGYLGLSRNPDVNRQIPYLASAGMAVVILAAVGGAFIVAEQLRNDDRRMAELEEAVRSLASAVAPAIEAPARLAGSAGSTGSPTPASFEEPSPPRDQRRPLRAARVPRDDSN